MVENLRSWIVGGHIPNMRNLPMQMRLVSEYLNPEESQNSLSIPSMSTLKALSAPEVRNKKSMPILMFGDVDTNVIHLRHENGLDAEGYRLVKGASSTQNGAEQILSLRNQIRRMKTLDRRGRRSDKVARIENYDWQRPSFKAAPSSSY